MVCESNAQLLHAYLDGELDLVRSLEIEEHLKACAGCAQELQSQQTLRKAMRSANLYQRAPRGLEGRIRAGAFGDRRRLDTVDSASDRPVLRRYLLQWVGVAAAVVLAAALGFRLVSGAHKESSEELLAQEAVASHIRSLQPGHLFDVESTDQHTVKPWFDGKVDFAPPVPAFADQGFPLVGGRLDYLGHRDVAALVYQRRKHVINVFLWPEASADSGGAGAPQSQQSISGYNLIIWRQGGMRFIAVSDLSTDELHQFVQLLNR